MVKNAPKTRAPPEKSSSSGQLCEENQNAKYVEPEPVKTTRMLPECVRRKDKCVTHNSGMVRVVTKTVKWTKVKFGYANRTHAIVSWKCVFGGISKHENRETSPSSKGDNVGNNRGLS